MNIEYLNFDHWILISKKGEFLSRWFGRTFGMFQSRKKRLGSCRTYQLVQNRLSRKSSIVEKKIRRKLGKINIIQIRTWKASLTKSNVLDQYLSTDVHTKEG